MLIQENKRPYEKLGLKMALTSSYPVMDLILRDKDVFYKQELKTSTGLVTSIDS